MPRNSVFHSQHSGHCVSVFEEQAVMSHAKPQYYVEFSPGLLKGLCLSNRVTHRLIFTGMHLMNNSRFLLVDSACLADNAYDIKSIFLQES